MRFLHCGCGAFSWSRRWMVVRLTHDGSWPAGLRLIGLNWRSRRMAEPDRGASAAFRPMCRPSSLARRMPARTRLDDPDCARAQRSAPTITMIALPQRSAGVDLCSRKLTNLDIEEPVELQHPAHPGSASPTSRSDQTPRPGRRRSLAAAGISIMASSPGRRAFRPAEILSVYSSTIR